MSPISNADPFVFEALFSGKLIQKDPAHLTNPAGCAAPLGHLWPTEGSGPCKRCGQSSALPDSPTCRHGVPNHGAFGGHDCTYADARDALIPYAEATADAATNDPERWNRIFHRTMNQLGSLLRHTP